MSDIVLYSLLFIAGLVGWVLSASPLLKFLIYAAEKDYRWALLGWFTVLTSSIFLMKFSLFSITGWPPPESLSSRIFYPICLFGSYAVPFVLEYLRTKFPR
jgi:hypothetical protein